MFGRIYKLSGGGKFYIGSTTQTLNLRLKNHRSKSKEETRKHTPLYIHFNQIGWSQCTIEMIIEQEFESKKTMLEMERKYIDINIKNNECLNHNRPTITPSEKKQRDHCYGKIHRSENKETERQRVAAWRKNNPEKHAEQVKRSVEKQRSKRIFTRQQIAQV